MVSSSLSCAGWIDHEMEELYALIARDGGEKRRICEVIERVMVASASLLIRVDFQSCDWILELRRQSPAGLPFQVAMRRFYST